MHCHYKENTPCTRPDTPDEPKCRGCQVFFDAMTDLNSEAYAKIEADRRIADSSREIQRHVNSFAERHPWGGF